MIASKFPKDEPDKRLFHRLKCSNCGKVLPNRLNEFCCKQCFCDYAYRELKRQGYKPGL